MTRHLVHETTGERIKPGDTIADFRGDKFVVRGWPQNGHNRIYVVPEGAAEDSMPREFFPAVFDLLWQDDDGGRS